MSGKTLPSSLEEGVGTEMLFDSRKARTLLRNQTQLRRRRYGRKQYETLASHVIQIPD